MTNIPEQDLSIMGDRVVAGGRYRRINVMGELRMEGDVRCLSLNCMGDAVVTGSFQAQKLSVMGDMEFQASADIGQIGIMGDAEFLSDLRSREIHAMGDLKVKGTVNADLVKIRGDLAVSGDCNADVFRSTGTFRVGGLLSVDSLEMSVWGPCKASEIGGSRIEVRRRKGILGALFAWDALLSATGLKRREGRLEADAIEGDEVVLEDTTARVVRGRRVVIGPGCDIGLVEHSGHLSRHRDSRVGEVSAT